jgi:ornithine cyclodeaminase/alanine dehydrogenase-like protein (mu-crystallin family)
MLAMSRAKTILYLSETTLSELNISTEEAVGAIEELFPARAAGTVWSAPKSVITPPDGRLMMTTLAASEEPAIMSVKSLVLNGRNNEQGLPSINSLITVLDSITGVPLAIMDGNWITAIRTACLSAIAAKRLARPASAAVAFIGCGVQAQRHLIDFAALFPLREVHLFGRGQDNINALRDSAEALGLSVVICNEARAAVAAGDIVISSISTAPQQAPFLDARWLKPGAFAASVDVGGPWLQQSLSVLDQIIIDDLEQETGMAKKMVTNATIDGDLAGLISGAVSGRKNDTERTAFIFRAHPLGDLALASLALKKAAAGNQGSTIKA